MKYLSLLTILWLCSCANPPKIVADKGAVYGVLSADFHPLIKNRMQSNDSIYSDEEGDDHFQGNRIDYAQLQDLYVSLILPNYKQQHHQIIVDTDGLSPRSLALSPNDILHIYNKTAREYHFFIAEKPDSGDGFQSFPALAAGANASYTIKLTGDLELLTDEDESLKTILFSKQNMLSQRVACGDHYQFENLTEGQYQLNFWYWRLGKIQQSIEIKKGENTQVNVTLTVDSVMQAH